MTKKFEVLASVRRNVLLSIFESVKERVILETRINHPQTTTAF